MALESLVEEIDIPRADNSVCSIKNSPDKGRGLYACRFIPRNTVVEISPVLLFSKEEYETHGKHTVLDHYTFVWTQGRMALALGLGSLFNHDQSPNISYSLDTKRNCIQYTSTRDINIGEELCIFYGHNLWFKPANDTPGRIDADIDDGWGGLAAVGESVEESFPANPYAEGDQDEIIAEEDLPFVRFKPPPEEEDAETIRTVEVWVVDVPQPKHITTLLKWLKQVGLDGPELGHLKRIRKQKDSATTTLLLCPISSMAMPNLPSELELPSPYIIRVPVSSALTPTSLALKTALWPTMYTPRRKDEPEPWSRGKLRWAWDAMQRTLDMASRAHSEDDELPIGALIPEPFGTETPCSDTPSAGLSFVAGDTRRSTNHPLRHAAINAVRQMADYRAAQDAIQLSAGDILTEVSAAKELEATSDPEEEESRNGSNYLLTDRTFFISHEPCIMCSMALLHSRVKEVVYMYQMPETGGCGGSACLPILKGVNHRFGILQWKLDDPSTKAFVQKNIELDHAIDA